MAAQVTPTPQDRTPPKALAPPPHLAVLVVRVSSLVFLHPDLPFPPGYFVNSNRAGAAGEEKGHVTTQGPVTRRHGWQVGTRVLME